jgi:hypothetical protein
MGLYGGVYFGGAADGKGKEVAAKTVRRRRAVSGRLDGLVEREGVGLLLKSQQKGVFA